MISGRDRSQPWLDMRHGFDQFACVSGFGLSNIALFNDTAVLQHDGPIARHANDVEVVGLQSAIPSRHRSSRTERRHAHFLPRIDFEFAAVFPPQRIPHLWPWIW
jgi:hypothetical protein